MSRLPINPVLYLAITGLVAADGHQFYQAVQDRRPFDNDAQGRNLEQFKQLAMREDPSADVGRGGYESEIFQKFAVANFIGKEPEKPPEVVNGDEGSEVEVVETPQTPLEEIFVLLASMSETDETSSRVVIQYLPSANVQPPPEVLETMQQRDVTPVRPTTPTRSPRGARGGARPVPTPPTGSAIQSYAHHLSVEDTLWPPYDHIRLVRVADDGPRAFFKREDPKVDPSEWKEEAIDADSVLLQRDVLEQLAAMGATIRPGEVRDADPNTASGPIEPSGWVPMADTREVGRGRYNIGTDDSAHFSRNPERIFNEDIGTASWRSSTGKMTGVRVTRVAPQYQRYGVQTGDIILSVNGRKVSGKTQALKVGKQLYRKGERIFTVEILSGTTGQRSTKTYVAPDQ